MDGLHWREVSPLKIFLDKLTGIDYKWPHKSRSLLASSFIWLGLAWLISIMEFLVAHLTNIITI